MESCSSTLHLSLTTQTIINSSLVAVPSPTFLHHPSYIYKPVCGLVLILVWGRKQVPVICNPAKGKVQTLPKVPRYQKDTPRRIYLGYDPVGKQFKVLCMNMKNIIPNTHWILTLESGKCLWRSLEPNFNLRENTGFRGGDICINGVLYLEGTMEGSFVILCFDVRSEKFSFINKDEDMMPRLKYHHSPLTLFNCKDKLCLHRRVGQNVVLWVVEDAGSHKWSKHSYVLPPLEEKILDFTKFVGMTSRTGEVVYSSNSSCVLFYNIERTTVSKVNIEGLEGLNPRSICSTFVEYVENLKFI